MPLVLKSLKTFLPAKTRNRYYRIHTSIPPCPPDTHTPLRCACEWVAHSPPPPPPAELPIPPHPHPPADPPTPPRKFWQITGGVAASSPVVVAPRGYHQHTRT